MLRAAPNHDSVRAVLYRWYGCSGSRFRKRSSPFPYRWGLLLRAAPEHGSVRAAPHRWCSCSGSRCRRHSSPFPYRWELLLHAVSDHGYLGLFRRIPHHTPHRPLWRCRLLCHRCSLQYQLCSSSCSCGCVCRCRRMTTRPIRDREWRIPRRIFHRFCPWCRWDLGCRRYGTLYTEYRHRCGSSGIQLHKPYDRSNHIFRI